MLPAPLRRVALIAGEASGDQLGASVIEGLRARHPNLARLQEKLSPRPSFIDTAPA